MIIQLGFTFLLLSGFQGPTQSPRTALVVGQVIDTGSGRPVAGAIVGINVPSSPQGPPPRVLTGVDGRFVFRDLRRGEYTITATKAGFAEGAHGRLRAGGPSVPLTLNEGARVGDVVIRLWRHAAISGTIVDESGERLVGIQVRAFRRTVVGGRRRFIASNLGTSDDRGIYRIGGLLPGDYLVGTLSRQAIVPLSFYRGQPPGAPPRIMPAEVGLLAPSEGTGLAMIHAGEAGIVLSRGIPMPPPPMDGRLSVYPATFHPSAISGAASSVITIQPGEEHVNADLQLTPVPTVRVSGFLFGPEGPVGRSMLRLIPANTSELHSDLDLPTTVTDNTGRFIFPAVPSGHYTLALGRSAFSASGGNTGGPLWLDGTLTVGTDDIDGVALNALPGVRVSGRVEFEGDPSRSRGQLPNLQIMIEPADIVPGTAAFFTRPGTFGEFVSTPIPGGRYYVRVPNSPAGWMFKSATIDGRDAADTPFTLREEPTSVVITFTDRWSGIRGTVQATAGRDAGALVLVFPTDRDTWGSSGLNPRRVRSVRPSRNGDYSVNLPPGEYYIVAVPEELSAEWQDPEVLEGASRGAARVTVGEGERKVQDLRTKDFR